MGQCHMQVAVHAMESATRAGIQPSLESLTVLHKASTRCFQFQKTIKLGCGCFCFHFTHYLTINIVLRHHCGMLGGCRELQDILSSLSAFNRPSSNNAAAAFPSQAALTATAGLCAKSALLLDMRRYSCDFYNSLWTSCNDTGGWRCNGSPSFIPKMWRSTWYRMIVEGAHVRPSARLLWSSIDLM